MTYHLIEGAPGCAYARDHSCNAVIVDALRASATAAMLLDAGATEIHVVASVDAALALKPSLPNALLYGERGGLPPEGFDHGNSPRETAPAAGRPIIFTTSNGSARLIDAEGAADIYMASTTNALALVAHLAQTDRDTVLIPAGNLADPEFDAQEDWAAATAIAMLADTPIGEGALLYRDWRHRLELDGLVQVFESAPHTQILNDLGLTEDVAYCAQLNITNALPKVTDRLETASVLTNARD